MSPLSFVNATGYAAILAVVTLPVTLPDSVYVHKIASATKAYDDFAAKAVLRGRRTVLYDYEVPSKQYSLGTACPESFP
jgi:hypothetical protein